MAISKVVHSPNQSGCDEIYSTLPGLSNSNIVVSPQSRNVPLSKAAEKVHVSLRAPVKRRRAMLASNLIEE